MLFNTINSLLQIVRTNNQDILAPDQAYEGLYGQGPPNGTGNGRSYQQGNCFQLNYYSSCFKFHILL